MAEETQQSLFGEDYLESAPFPPVTEALVVALDKLFPDKCPSLGDPDRLIWVKAGQRAVVRFLAEKLREQQETNNVLQ
jgi:hypothetical protein